jgi:hypothetical protein
LVQKKLLPDLLEWSFAPTHWQQELAPTFCVLAAMLPTLPSVPR